MPQISSRSPIIALAVLIFGHFLNHFYAYVLAASLFIIREDVLLSNTEVGLVGTAQIVIFAVFSVLVGITGDRWLKRKTIYVPFGVLLMGVSMFIVGYANSFITLIFAALVVGLGASFYHPVAYAAIADLYEEKKGLTMSANVALGMIGTSITPVFIVVFDRWIGWRSFFIVFGIAALILAVALFFVFHFLIEYTRSEDEEKEYIANKNMNMEGRISQWFKKEFFVVLSIFIIICLFYSTFRSGIFRITNTFLSIIFVDYYDFNIFQAGWITTVILVIGGLTAIIGGIISDKYTTSLTMLISLSGSTIMLLLLVILGDIVSGIGAIALFFVFIAFLYFSGAAGTKYVSENVPQKSRSLALGFLFAVPSSLAGLFPWAFGWMLDNSTHIFSFVFLLALAFMGTLMCLVLFRRDIQIGRFRIRKQREIDVIATDDTL